jgi:SRSO17 transposase
LLSKSIGNVPPLANGVVWVNAYGVLDTVTFPLAVRIFQPPRRLKPGDVYTRKPQLAIELIQELTAQGLHFSVVLADSMYGERGEVTAALARLGLSYVVAIRSNVVAIRSNVVAIRSNHLVWTFPGERVRPTRWRPFARVFTAGTAEQRERCEFVFGKRTCVRSFVITTDPVRLPPETTWPVMTHLPGQIERSVGNTFGLRTWIEIVCMQMTKTDMLSFGRSRDNVANLDLAIGDHHAVD